MSETLYLKFEKSSEVNVRNVSVGDIASVWCKDKAIAAKVRTIKLVRIPDVKKGRYAFSVMKVIEQIVAECPNVDVENIGEPDFIIEYRKNISNKWFDCVKVAVVSVIVFIGSAFSIMAYNNDIGIGELFNSVYGIFLGNSQGNGLLELSYSIGLTAGIAVFYNHFVGKRFTSDPTPVEIQMRLYEQNIDDAIIEEAKREGIEHDVV